MAARPALHGMADIRAFFRTNGTPIYFVSPTAFNLLGLDRWVRDFFYVTYFDSFQGHHPRGLARWGGAAKPAARSSPAGADSAARGAIIRAEAPRSARIRRCLACARPMPVGPKSSSPFVPIGVMALLESCY